MSKLQQAREAANLKQSDVLPVVRGIEPKFDSSLLSKAENGLCLPTAEVSNLLCKMYRKKPSEIYDPSEVDFGVMKSRRKPTPCDHNVYKLTGRIQRRYIDSEHSLTEMVLACGYVNINEWLTACYCHLQANFKAIQTKVG